MLKKLVALVAVSITFLHPQKAFAQEVHLTSVEISNLCVNSSSPDLCIKSSVKNNRKEQNNLLSVVINSQEKKSEKNSQKEEKLGLNATVLFQMVSEVRKNANLPLFEVSENLCSLAKERAHEIYYEIFVSGQMHKGLYDRKLPYRVTENIIGMRTEEKALEWWMNSKVHRSSILGDFAYSCMACENNTCAQLFSNYTPVSN